MNGSQITDIPFWKPLNVSFTQLQLSSPSNRPRFHRPQSRKHRAAATQNKPGRLSSPPGSSYLYRKEARVAASAMIGYLNFHSTPIAWLRLLLSDPHFHHRPWRLYAKAILPFSELLSFAIEYATF